MGVGLSQPSSLGCKKLIPLRCSELTDSFTILLMLQPRLELSCLTTEIQLKLFHRIENERRGTVEASATYCTSFERFLLVKSRNGQRKVKSSLALANSIWFYLLI